MLINKPTLLKTTITEPSAPRGFLVPEAWSPFWSKVSGPTQGDEFSAPIGVTVPPRPSDWQAPKSRSQTPKNRDTLVRELQKRLKRAGCYHGNDPRASSCPRKSPGRSLWKTGYRCGYSSAGYYGALTLLCIKH